MSTGKWAMDVVNIARSLFKVIGGQVVAHPIVMFGQGLALVTLGAILDDDVLSFGGWFLFALIPVYYMLAILQVRRLQNVVLRRLAEEPWDAEARIPGLIRSSESIGTFQVIVTAIAIVLTLVGLYLEFGAGTTAAASAFFIFTLVVWGLAIRRLSAAERGTD